MSRDRIIQLQECAEELGFSTIQEAIDAGYHEVQDLVSDTFTLKHRDAINAEGALVEQEKAHQAWLKEKEHKLHTLRLTAELCRNSDMPNTADDLAAIADFFEKGEC